MDNNRLEEIRESFELSKKELADKLEVSDSIYSRWEKCKDIIPTRRLYQLANFYELNIDYILGLTDKKIKLKSADDIDINIVSSRMRVIRKDCCESLVQFTKKINTSASTWSAYETGKVLVLCAFLIEVCRINSISIDWALGRTDDKYIK